MTQGAPNLLITGTGRCGTGYIARVLTLAGVACGHEEWWNPQGDRAPGLAADASWWALVELGDWDGPVFHQHRHPLRVATSLALRPPHEPYRSGYVQLMGEDPYRIEDWAALATVSALECAETLAEWSWRVDRVGAKLVRTACRRAGYEVAGKRAHDAIKATARDTNTHWDGDRLRWEDIPSAELRQRLWDATRALGYPVHGT